MQTPCRIPAREKRAFPRGGVPACDTPCRILKRPPRGSVRNESAVSALDPGARGAHNGAVKKAGCLVNIAIFVVVNLVIFGVAKLAGAEVAFGKWMIVIMLGLPIILFFSLPRAKP